MHSISKLSLTVNGIFGHWEKPSVRPQGTKSEYIINKLFESCGDQLRLVELFSSEAPLFSARHFAPVERRELHHCSSCVASFDGRFFWRVRRTENNEWMIRHNLINRPISFHNRNTEYSLLRFSEIRNYAWPTLFKIFNKIFGQETI